MSEKKVAVVVPVYKDELNDFEKIALKQIQKNFAWSRIIFAAPEGKNFSYIPEGGEIVYFQNEDFFSLLSYRNLILGKSLYKKIFGCENALIYKLDSFSPANEIEFSLLKSYVKCFENMSAELSEEIPSEKSIPTSQKISSDNEDN